MITTSADHGRAAAQQALVVAEEPKATHRCLFASMPRPAGAMLKRWEEGRVRRNDGATSASGRRKNETNAGSPPWAPAARVARRRELDSGRMAKFPSLRSQASLQRLGLPFPLAT